MFVTNLRMLGHVCKGNVSCILYYIILYYIMCIYYIAYVWGLQQTNSQWLCCLWMMMKLGTLALGSPTYHEQGQFRCINLPSWNPTFHSDVRHVRSSNLIETWIFCVAYTMRIYQVPSTCEISIWFLQIAKWTPQTIQSPRFAFGFSCSDAARVCNTKSLHRRYSCFMAGLQW